MINTDLSINSYEQRVACDSFAREWERSSNFPSASCASSGRVFFHRKCDAISYERKISPRQTEAHLTIPYSEFSVFTFLLIKTNYLHKALYPEPASTKNDC